MGIKKALLLFIVISWAFLFLTCNASTVHANFPFDDISAKDFPKDFLFGAASSAYQYEGAVSREKYGRGPSIWDVFVKEQAEKIADGTTGEIAEDFYNRYPEDIFNMKYNTGLRSFRFSISWSRILPDGKVGNVNQQGVNFYKKLITKLIENDIEPTVTLFHWDTPQALEDAYGGFLSKNIVKDFRDYVDFCFHTFGDKVKKWITFNEPYIFSTGGYESGIRAPGRCSHYAGNCTAGNSATEPYIVIHNLLLAHAQAVQLYRQNYQETQKGIIGITETSVWAVPKFYTPESSIAAYRALDFLFGWVVNPVTYGDYPEIMKTLLDCRLPKFTKEESELLKGSYDFLGLNYYTANYAQDSNVSCIVEPRPQNDNRVILSFSKDGIPIGTETTAVWLHVYPRGLEELLLYIKEKYNNPIIYITENGVVDTPPYNQDLLRIKYHHDHLYHTLQAMKRGARVKGYFVWSFLDCWEWSSGYTLKFGLYHIDRQNKLKRIKKNSINWFKRFLTKGEGQPNYPVSSE